MSAPLASACDLLATTLLTVAVAALAITSIDSVLLPPTEVAVISVGSAFVSLNLAVATPSAFVTLEAGVNWPVLLSLLQLTVAPCTGWLFASTTIAVRVTLSFPATTPVVLSAVSVEIFAVAASAAKTREEDSALTPFAEAVTT